MILTGSTTFSRCLANNVFWAFLPIMPPGSLPKEDGVNWKTNVDSEERESTGSKKYEDPINVQDKTPEKYKTPDNPLHDDTLTMHTTDVVSTLKRSVIYSIKGQSFLDKTPPSRLKEAYSEIKQ
jgi:hypothetical protein